MCEEIHPLMNCTCDSIVHNFIVRLKWPSVQDWYIYARTSKQELRTFVVHLTNIFWMNSCYRREQRHEHPHRTWRYQEATNALQHRICKRELMIWIRNKIVNNLKYDPPSNKLAVVIEMVRKRWTKTNISRLEWKSSGFDIYTSPQ